MERENREPCTHTRAFNITTINTVDSDWRLYNSNRCLQHCTEITTPVRHWGTRTNAAQPRADIRTIITISPVPVITPSKGSNPETCTSLPNNFAHSNSNAAHESAHQWNSVHPVRSWLVLWISSHGSGLHVPLGKAKYFHVVSSWRSFSIPIKDA